MTLDRDELILRAATEWTIEQKRKHLESVDGVDLASLADELSSIAEEAYNVLAATSLLNSTDNYLEHEAAFHSAAADYFQFGLHRRSRINARTFASLDWLKKEWFRSLPVLEECESYEDLLEAALFYPEIEVSVSRLPRRVGEDFDVYIGRLKQFVSNDRRVSFDREFSESAIYEALGREYAIRHFRMKSRGRGAPEQPGNLDTYRAFQFDQLLQAINGELREGNHREASKREVCRVIFDQVGKADDADFTKALAWLLAEHFQAANISEASFVNSLSRGRHVFGGPLHLRFLWRHD